MHPICSSENSSNRHNLISIAHDANWFSVHCSRDNIVCWRSLSEENADQCPIVMGNSPRHNGALGNAACLLMMSL